MVDLPDVILSDHIVFNRKSFDFHFKYNHRAVYTESRLKQMGRSDGNCKLCKTKTEDLCHLLFECIHIKNI